MTEIGLHDRVTAILADGTLAEKVSMMSGRGCFAADAEDGGRRGPRPYRAGSGLERIGLEPLWFTDGPRGVARGESSCFPCTMARGASFEFDLERRIGEAAPSRFQSVVTPTGIEPVFQP